MDNWKYNELTGMLEKGLMSQNEVRKELGLERGYSRDCFYKTIILEDFDKGIVECQYCAQIMTSDWHGGPCPHCGGRVR